MLCQLGPCNAVPARPVLVLMVLSSVAVYGSQKAKDEMTELARYGWCVCPDGIERRRGRGVWYAHTAWLVLCPAVK